MSKDKKIFYSMLFMVILILSTISIAFIALRKVSDVSAQTSDQIYVHSEVPTEIKHMDLADTPADPTPIHLDNVDQPIVPFHMDLQDPSLDFSAPITSNWHELYPQWSNPWHLSSWHDNGDNVLSPSDQIDMYNEQTGETMWFHVDRITTTIFWTEKQTAIPGAMEPIEDYGDPITNPISTDWHQIFPQYSNMLHITSWDDNGDGYLSPSDQIDMYNATDGLTRWYHIDRISIDLVLTPKPPGGDPISTRWLELYPWYNNYLHLTSWIDDGDGVLSKWDIIDMYNETDGTTDYYHVDELTTTIHLSGKTDPDLIASLENLDPANYDPAYPIGTGWHEVYPQYSNMLNLTSWTDNGDGVLSPSDQIDMYNATDGSVSWWHVDRISTDLIVSKEPDPTDPITDPLTTNWHELYPDYSNPWHLSSWEDNGDGVLSPSDQIDMVNGLTGETEWFHVDRVTTTIFWTEKNSTSEGAMEPIQNLAWPITYPISTDWHQIFPQYSNMLHITSWEDNGDGYLSPSDQIDMYNATDGLTRWYHIDRISTDIVLTTKPPIDDPISTLWHELYPMFSNWLHLTSWEDNGDGVLSPSDQIDMYNETDGTTDWYHVDNITTTLLLTDKATGGIMYVDLVNPINFTNPISSNWHEIYPVFSNMYHLVSWTDNGDGVLSPSDQIMLYDPASQIEIWYHIDEMGTDLILTKKDGTPPPPPWFIKSPYPDYAPSAMPDFDQKQDGWFDPTVGQWTWCGPVSVANSMWWFDSKYETNTVGPPAIVDNFRLVTAYGAWDDHDPRNVFPLVNNLAFLMDTDGQRTGLIHTGTNYIDMQTGISQYLQQQGINPLGDADGDGDVDANDIAIINAAMGTTPGAPGWDMRADIIIDNIIDILDLAAANGNLGLTGIFYEHTEDFPDFTWIEDEVYRSQDVVLMLDFWIEIGPEEWYRLEDEFGGSGGHYVTVAGVNSTTYELLISDPFLDNFEAGLTPGHSPVAHPYPHGTDVHNDTQFVSHDAYLSAQWISPPSSPYGPVPVWELVGYLQTIGLPPEAHAFIRAAVVTSPLEDHDVAVINKTTSKTGCLPFPTVGKGQNITINVTVENQGTTPETFNTTVYANSNVSIEIGSQEVTLNPGQNQTLTFVWDTTGVTYGNYTIVAIADTVPGEVDTADNTLVNGIVLVTITGDVDGNQLVNIFDIVRIASRYQMTYPDPDWDPNADLIENGIINIFDVVAGATNYQKSWP